MKPQCATCRHWSRQDICCQLDGRTRRKGDSCPQWTDGKVRRASGAINAEGER